MTKKIGISLIIVFIVFCFLLSYYNDYLTKGQNALLILVTGSVGSVSGALIPMNLPVIKRNKIKRIYLIISISLVVLGLSLRYYELPGAGVAILIGPLWYCFAFAPLEAKHKYLKWKPFSKSRLEIISLSSIDFFGLNFIALGLLFRIFQWPHSTKFIIIGALILALGLIFWNLKFKKQVILRKQSEDLLKIQHKEITDSITYAKRIQSAILPNQKLVKEYLNKSFVLYKPKDIVAGDFYWVEPLENKVLFASADCTGHGVPGALVSVVCNNALNRSVREFNLVDPGEILDKTKELVILEFEKADEQMNDGMDIALCSLEGMTLKYAGANTSLWVAQGEEIIEIKSDKQPVGIYPKSSPFTTHTIELKKGDTIYLFSDGFPDQFGGEKEKKYKRRNLVNFILSIQKYSMPEQCGLLEQEFANWKGDLEQVDDVCLMGVRL